MIVPVTIGVLALLVRELVRWRWRPAARRLRQVRRVTRCAERGAR